MSQDNTTTSTDEELVEQLYKGRTRRMYPEVAQYLREFQEVQWAIEDRESAFYVDQSRREREMYRAAERQGRQFDRYDRDHDTYQAFQAENRRRTQERNQLDHEARQNLRSLLVDSPHREVKWIAEHCLFNNQGNEVEGYARDILAILPATTEEIWAEAKDNRGMCDVFDRFYGEAEADGIFTDGKKLAGQREIAAFRNYVRRSYGSGYVRDMTTHLDRVVKAIRDHYEAEMVAAKAEWQGLDEAWRSERSRRAAATRAANREAQEALSEDIAEGEENIRTAGVFDDAGQFHPQTPESQPEAPKASAQDDFVLANSN